MHETTPLSNCDISSVEQNSCYKFTQQQQPDLETHWPQPPSFDRNAPLHIHTSLSHHI